MKATIYVLFSCCFVFTVLSGCKGPPVRHSTLPSIPTFSGAPKDRQAVDTALAAAGMSLVIPPGNPPKYVAPVAGCAAAGVPETGAGTRHNPYHNLIRVVRDALPGDRIYLEPGTYFMDCMRQKFGEKYSELIPRNSGNPGKPIVIETDPAELNWAAGNVASIDFQLKDANGPRARNAAVRPMDYWVIENLDMRNALDRIIWLSASHDLILNNDLHHVALTGEDNVGIVDVMRRHGGDCNDFIIGNNIHGIARYDSRGRPLRYYAMDSVNVGCTYSELNQVYSSNNSLHTFPKNGNSLTIAQLAGYTTPPDNNVYFYRNLIHNCARGIGTKLPEYGPWYLLSNEIYNVQTGIKIVLSGSIVRNNIIFAKGMVLRTGIKVGMGDTNWFLGNADNVVIAHNTIIGAVRDGTEHYGGFNDDIYGNIFALKTETAHLILPEMYVDGGVNTSGKFWYEHGKWPGVVGEYLYDVGQSNPYYADMPDFLQQEAGAYKAISFHDNLYTRTPRIQLGAAPDVGSNLNGSVIDKNYKVMSWRDLAPLFRNSTAHDYRARLVAPGVLAT